MAAVTYVLVPGLGDQKRIFGWFYNGVSKRWQRKGMKTVIFHPRWIGEESYPAKQQRLGRMVAQAGVDGSRIVLVGISAGAALCAVALQDSHSVARAVLVCPFVQLKESDRQNKALTRLSWFKAGEAAEELLPTLSERRRKDILCLISRSDRVVEPERQEVRGATVIHMHSHGHLLSIVVALYFYRRVIERFSTSRD